VRHFLPRLLELTLDGDYDAIDLDGVVDKLEYEHWRSWPPTEQQAMPRSGRPSRTAPTARSGTWSALRNIPA
jgi:hypothetical protein